MAPRGIVLAALLAAASPAAADDLSTNGDFSANGFADVSLVKSSGQQTWLDGGLGKLRYGSGGGAGTDFQLNEIAVDARAEPTPEILGFVSLRYEPKQKTAFDVLEAYGRYTAVDTQALEWTVKLGAFFPPISLENEGIGWTSPWTITPSAINSWVGEELRTIGGETTAEWRFGESAVSATAALFGWADPAGTLLADRGWALDDRPTGLLDRVRLPNALAYDFHENPPLYQEPFKAIGGGPGWYGMLAWRQDGIGRIAVLQYDNEGDPSATRDGQIAWRTSFTSVAAEGDIGEVVLLAQGMTGRTEIDPSPFFHMITHFKAAYLLAGWNFADDWTLAGRVDLFTTHTPINPDDSEHGRALTVDTTWRPRTWLRLSTEALWLDSTRQQREDADVSPRAIETQFQFSARVLF